MKKIIPLFFFFCAYALRAEFINNPDANTLWIETGKNIQTAAKTGMGVWNNKSVTVSSLPSGGFSLKSDNPSPKDGHTSLCYVPMSKEYPYLVFEIDEILPFKGYRNWSIAIKELKAGFTQITNGQPGIFAVNCYENGDDKARELKKMQLCAYLFDFELKMKYIKMVKKPDNYVELTSPGIVARKELNAGDKIKITAYLKEPAEDVSARLVLVNSLLTIKINGEQNIQLKPEDDPGKIWSCELTINELGPLPRRNLEKIKRNSILIRVTVLGGNLSVPLWGVINYEYNKSGKK